MKTFYETVLVLLVFVGIFLSSLISMTTFIITYTIFALSWASFAVYKTRQRKKGKEVKQQLIAFFMNLIIFPLSLPFAVITNKL